MARTRKTTQHNCTTKKVGPKSAAPNSKPRMKLGSWLYSSILILLWNFLKKKVQEWYTSFITTTKEWTTQGNALLSKLTHYFIDWFCQTLFAKVMMWFWRKATLLPPIIIAGWKLAELYYPTAVTIVERLVNRLTQTWFARAMLWVWRLLAPIGRWLWEGLKNDLKGIYDILVDSFYETLIEQMGEKEAWTLAIKVKDAGGFFPFIYSKIRPTLIQTPIVGKWITAPAKHPTGLYVLFFTEMWERFGFYLMVALFTLYLNEKLGLSEAEATEIYGRYMFFVYLSPFFGGIFADRVCGYRRAILTGAILLAAGYFVFAVQSKLAFNAAMVLLVVGNGLFKPNISTLVGNLYPRGDGRRDSAFSIFYMGINLGAMFAGPVGETVRTEYGWSAAFATAGVGLLIGRVVFWKFQHHLAAADGRSSVSAVTGVPISDPQYEDRDPPQIERQRIIALTIMCGIVMMFWMAFQQNGATLSFWARDNTERMLRIGNWSWEIPPGWFQAVNSIFVIVFTPMQVKAMSFLRKHKLEPSTPAKIGIGMGWTALAFWIMRQASVAGGNTGRVSMLWLIAGYGTITIGELFLSPMGLSMVTKLAPRRMTSMLMGLWFISTAIGNYLSGFIGRFWKVWTHERFFGMLVMSSLFAVAVLLTQRKRLNAAMPPEGLIEEEEKPNSAPAVVPTAPASAASAA